MSEKDFYIKFNPSDWLNDPYLQLCPDEVQGFWINLMCRMTRLFPYGHLSKLNVPELQKKLSQKKGINPGVEQGVNPPVNPGVVEWDGLGVDFYALFTHEEMLEMSLNMEEYLPQMMGRPPETIARYIKILEELGVFSRTANGIIYSRRLSRDYRKRMQDKINGGKGGNPNLKKKKGRKKVTKNAAKPRPEPVLQGVNPPPNPNDNPPVEHGVNGAVVPPVEAGVGTRDKAIYNYNYDDDYNNSVGKVNTGENVTGEAGKKQNTTDVDVGERLAVLKKKLQGDKIFIDPILMQTGVTAAALEQWSELFNINLLASDKVEHDYREYKKHFRNWLYKQPYQQPPPAPPVKKADKGNSSKNLVGKYT